MYKKSFKQVVNVSVIDECDCKNLKLRLNDSITYTKLLETIILNLINKS